MLPFGRTRLLPQRKAASFRLLGTGSSNTCSWSRRLPTAVDCWGQENSPVPAALFPIPDLWEAGGADSDAEEGCKAWQWLLPGGERASPALLGSQPAPAPLSLSVSPALPLTSRGEKFSFAWRDDPLTPGDLLPSQALRQSPASLPHHRPRRFLAYPLCASNRPWHGWVCQAGPPAVCDKWPAAKPS